jgi:hypothetical protein
VADAFSDPAPSNQHLLRLDAAWSNFNVENVVVYWPDMNDSWLNDLSVSTQIDSKLTAKINWQHTSQDSLLAVIGVGDSVAIELQFVDGF